MPGLVPGIHVLQRIREKDVDGRDEPGHDEGLVDTYGVSTARPTSLPFCKSVSA